MIFESGESDDFWDVYVHQYFFELQDKVYFSKLVNPEILSTWKQLFGATKMCDVLAGDIENEYSIIENESNIKIIEDELKIHMSRLLKDEVQQVNCKSSNKDTYDIWVNIMKPNEYNPLHRHDGIFSFVIYVDVHDSIREEHKFQNGNTPSRGLIEFSASRTNDSMKFNPKTGDILIFQSSHSHEVYPYTSDYERISLAGNIHGIEMDKSS